MADARGRGARMAGALAAVMLGGLILAGPARALQVGDRAPDFTLPAPGGKTVRLTDLTARGPVVIYTFIQAFTGV